MHHMSSNTNHKSSGICIYGSTSDDNQLHTSAYSQHYDSIINANKNKMKKERISTNSNEIPANYPILISSPRMHFILHSIQPFGSAATRHYPELITMIRTACFLPPLSNHPISETDKIPANYPLLILKCTPEKNVKHTSNT